MDPHLLDHTPFDALLGKIQMPAILLCLVGLLGYGLYRLVKGKQP